MSALVDPPPDLLCVVLRVPRRAVDRGLAKLPVPAGCIVMWAQKTPECVSAPARVLEPPAAPLCVTDAGLDMLVRVLFAGHIADSSLGLVS